MPLVNRFSTAVHVAAAFSGVMFELCTDTMEGCEPLRVGRTRADSNVCMLLFG